MPAMSQSDDQKAALDEQAQLIAQLEREVSRPGVGLLPPVAALAVVVSIALGVWMRADIAYFFSSREPIELGAEGGYHFDRALSNRYAQVHGVPTVKGWYVEEPEGSFVVVGVVDTPLLVKRITFEDENRRLPDHKRPQPRQNPFFARGRLLSRADAQRYGDVFRDFDEWSQSHAEWFLVAEQPPGKDLGALGMFSFVVIFGVVNAWLFVRGLTVRRKASKS